MGGALLVLLGIGVMFGGPGAGLTQGGLMAALGVVLLVIGLRAAP